MLIIYISRKMMSPSSSVQFSSNSVSVVKSVTLLNFKCAQLSKPEVTVSTNGEKKKIRWTNVCLFTWFNSRLHHNSDCGFIFQKISSSSFCITPESEGGRSWSCAEDLCGVHLETKQWYLHTL